MTDAARYLRQLLLVDVGAAGQARIAAATARVGGGTRAHAVAELYARRAGVATVAPAAADALTPNEADAALVTTPAAREALAGARLALTELRRALSSSAAPQGGHGR